MKSVVILEGSTIHTLVFLIFLLTVPRIRKFSSLKPSPSQKGIIPQNFSSLGLAVSEELGNIQTDSLTDRMVLLF